MLQLTAITYDDMNFGGKAVSCALADDGGL